MALKILIIPEIQGTSYLFFFPLPSRLEWVKNPPKPTLQPGNKPLLTQRPAGALMPTYQHRLMLRQAGLKQRPPIVHPSPQGSNLYQNIINAFHMRRRTAPGVPFRLLDQSSPDRVEFHIPGGRQKIPFVHHKRGKSPRPQMTPPALPEVDEPSIPVPRPARVGRNSVSVLRRMFSFRTHSAGYGCRLTRPTRATRAAALAPHAPSHAYTGGKRQPRP
jgi:hypothetical protein